MLSGIAMQMTGHSRPASGSEHHLSHYWEMKHAAEGRAPELHGIKVGVATLMILSLYDKILQLDIRAVVMSEKTTEQIVKWEQELTRCYGSLAQEMLTTNKALILSQAELNIRHTRLVAAWERIKPEIEALKNLVPDAAKLLERVHAPLTPAECDINETDTLDALRYAKEVRSRYTILQLADQLGLLEQYAKEITERLA
ncbi:Glycerol-1-phosphate dehydrogenase [NAD(P)+] [compost metagenome]